MALYAFSAVLPLSGETLLELELPQAGRRALGRQMSGVEANQFLQFLTFSKLLCT